MSNMRKVKPKKGLELIAKMIGKAYSDLQRGIMMKKNKLFEFFDSISEIVKAYSKSLNKLGFVPGWRTINIPQIRKSERLELISEMTESVLARMISGEAIYRTELLKIFDVMGRISSETPFYIYKVLTQLRTYSKFQFEYSS